MSVRSNEYAYLSLRRYFSSASRDKQWQRRTFRKNPCGIFSSPRRGGLSEIIQKAYNLRTFFWHFSEQYIVGGVASRHRGHLNFPPLSQHTKLQRGCGLLVVSDIEERRGTTRKNRQSNSGPDKAEFIDMRQAGRELLGPDKR